MGKQKGDGGGGRSKSRASSSSFSASLLPTGTPVVGFGGYLGGSRIEPPSSSDDSAPLPDVDSEVLQHLKRLGRKDPTTKLKALASLSLLFVRKPGEEIVQIVPQWVFEYKKLLLDYNREVRRATHETMASLVTTVKKGLAPHLKSLMGPWWFSQFDPAPEVAQAARRSFEAAFPQSERRLDSLMLCVKETFLYLDENLKLTAQALSDKATPMDELEDMHQRVISSSLLAIATLLDILLGVKLQNCDNDNVNTENKVLSKVRTATLSSAEMTFSLHKYFLDFIKSKSAAVRSATYSILRSYIQHIPHVFNEETMKVISSSVLGAFQEKDESCHSSMWDMILLFSRKFPESWSHCNIHKVVLNRFWHFLRNGCYGSKQISYPLLVQFLESIPLDAVAGEQLVFDFLHNLWCGRDQQHLSVADSLAFFSSFKQCFLWLLNNASRYSAGDSSNNIPVKLVNDILVKLLWHDYLLLSLPENQDVNSGKPLDESTGDGQLSDKKLLQAANMRYSTYYLQDLGSCIVEILAEISLKESDLLQAICASLKTDCLEIIHQGKNLPKVHEHTEQVVSFFLLLDQLVLQKGHTWPLKCLARPLVVESLPAIRSMDTPTLVKLLSILVEIFGPVTIFSHITERSDNNDEKSKMKLYLRSFNDDFVPWCLDGKSSTSSSKIDLLLSLMQDEYFFDQWRSIITYSTSHDKQSANTEASENLSQFELLALMLKKVRERISGRKFGNLQKNGSLSEHWRHDLLDSAAISVTCNLAARLSDAHFLCAALGGSVRDDQICFLSTEAVVNVLGQVLKSLALVLITSTFDWAKSSYALLLPIESEHLKHLEEPSLLTRYKMAQFAFEVLKGSIFCLGILDEDSPLLPSILAALFIIEWECSMGSPGCEENHSENGKDDIDIQASVSSNLEDYSDEGVYLKVNLVEQIHVFRQSIGPAFWSSFSSCILERLGSILVKAVRSAVFETRDLRIDRVSILCSQWVVDMLKAICLDHAQLQKLLDLVLAEGKYWPFWVKPDFRDGSGSASIQLEPVFTLHGEWKHHQFVAFVDKLILSLGFSEVILGVPMTHSTEVASSVSSFARAWLAAEILCTWKWPGGSALSSFLPSLIEYMKTGTSVLEGSIISLLLSILLDGALMHGTSQWILFHAWHLSDNGVEKIQEPFLRALIALLFTLSIKDNIWRKSDVILFFERVSTKLFIGSTVNRPCLRVLPFIMSVIIKPLFRISELDEASSDALQVSSDSDLVGESILGWLDAAISCLSPSPGELLQDVEDWTQVVLSCFPLRVTGGVRKSGVEILRDINDLEKSLLLTLFRKHQVFYDDTTSTSSIGGAMLSKSIELMEVKLTAVSVGYCWTELEEDDWHFVFDRVHKWIESSVLLIEEMVEGVDNTVVNYKSTDEPLEKLKLAVNSVDLLTLSIAEAALVIFCLVAQLDGLQEIEKFLNLLTIRCGKYAESRDQIMENILRLFLATGVSEAIANSCNEEASSIIASSRLDYMQFWELVASFVNSSSLHIRSSAVESMELWGLSKGSVSGLYAILFSSRPISCLQLAAYNLLLSEPLCRISLVNESCLEGNGFLAQESDLGHSLELTSQENPCLRDELSTFIQMPSSEILKMDLIAEDRVNVFIAWALLMSHLQLLPSSSTAREKLIQYIQDKISSSILDYIFQHIPLKTGAPSGKKKDAELVPEAYAAAEASKHAIVACSLMPYVVSLWPISTEHMASLAGSIYGMMIRLLPSYVRTWLTSLRDRSLSYAIESFTKTWCSPPLLSDEFSQLKDTVYADENFSVSVNKSAYEIVATYKKEETGMDLVIRLPNSYPLRHVSVECTRSLGISEVKQRKWLLSLTAFVRNQNGAIAEAIRTWKSNVDKEFEGVEECPICYSILHTSNHSLPRLACKTCRHKFHAACLYKWFSTSNKSTCPLCQTPF